MGLITRLELEAVLARNRFLAKKRADDSGLCQWGIVGTGYMAEQFARYLGRSKGMNVRAIHSRSQERGDAFAKRHGVIHAYREIDDLLEQETGMVDVVYVATPVSAHYKIAKRCLKAGYNVLCEKPLCEDISQARELFTIADNKSAQLFEGMWTLCLPTIRQAAVWVNSGRIGTITGVKASIRKNAQGGESGCLYDFGAYPLAFAVAFLGEGPHSVMASSTFDGDGADRAWDIRIADNVGVCAEIHLSTFSSGDSSATIIGNKGSIHIPSQFNRAAEVELHDVSGRLLETKSFQYRLDGFEYEIEDVANALKQGAKSHLDRDDTLAAIEIMTRLATGQYAALGHEAAGS